MLSVPAMMSDDLSSAAFASTAGGSGGASPRASTAGGSGGSSPRATQWRAPYVINVRSVLGVHRRGHGDPAFAVDAAGAIWRACRTPDGPGTLRIAARTDRSLGTFVEATAWGQGAEWLLDQLPALLGAHDDTDIPLAVIVPEVETAVPTELAALRAELERLAVVMIETELPEPPDPPDSELPWGSEEAIPTATPAEPEEPNILIFDSPSRAA